MTDVLAFVVLVILWMHLAGGKNPDDTDPPGDHSGLRVYVDQRTGCNYVSTMFGSLTPRLDRDGHIVCEPAHDKSGGP